MQHLMGIEGVIVDLVQEIKEAVSDMIKPTTIEDGGDKNLLEGDGKMQMQYWMGGVHFLLELDPFIINNGDYKCRLINLRDHHFDSNIILSCLGVHGGRLKMFDFELATNTFLVWDVNVNKEEYHGGFEKVAKDPSGKEINALEQHIKNLLNPSSPLFFNTLYDPYREDAGLFF
ncbi:hypothetical protein ACE6H2_016150 [Prunus campanulata]